MNIKIFSLTLLAMVMLNGCYTRLGSFDQLGDSYIVEGADSLIDSTSPGARVDTIIHREKEICVWERDFTGMPRLRCFPSYYNSDWYFYNNSPWWFRTSSYWYDYKRCPRYYYFDPHCGCCRYYQHYPYRRSSGGGKGGIGGSGGGGSSGRPDRSRGIGGSSSVPAPQGGATLPKTSGSSVDQKSSNPPPEPDRPNRSRGIGTSGLTPVAPSNQGANVEKKKAEAVVPESKPQGEVTPPNKPIQTNDSDVPRTRPKRNSRW